MSEYENMDEFLEGQQPETTEEVNEEEPEQVETKGEEETEPPAVEEEPKTETVQPSYEEIAARANAFQRKAEDEVRKRQAIEQQMQRPPEETPDFWENPEGVIKNQVDQVRQEIGQEFQTRLLNMSESSAKARHDDYDEKFHIFSQMVQRDPSVYQQMLQQPDPAEYVYSTAKRLMDIQSIGDVDAFKEKTRSEIRAEIEAEVKAEYEQKLTQANNLPQSFSEKGSKNAPKGEFAGPTSMESILAYK